MSLLADLLSKIKQPQTKREVPPNLKNIVNSSSGRKSDKRKIILLSVVLLVVILGGVFFVIFTKSLEEGSISTISRPAPEVLTEPEETVQAAPPVDMADKEPELTVEKEEEPSLTVKIEKTAPPPAEEPAAVETREEAEIVKVVEPPAEKPEITEPEIEEEVAAVEESVAEDKPRKIEKPLSERAIRDRHLYSARQYGITKNYMMALESYKKALSVDNDNYSIMNSISYLYLELGNRELASEYARMALNINPDYTPALINLAIADARSGNLTAAEESLNRTLGLEPTNIPALLNMAILKERGEDYAGAGEYYSRLIKLGSVDGSIGLARVYEKEDRIDDALKLYKDLLTLDNLDRKVRRDIQYRIAVLMQKKNAAELEKK